MTDDEGSLQLPQPNEHAEVFGSIDAGALREIRDLFVEQEPLFQNASFDGPLNPQMMSLKLSDGIGVATTARIDVQWSLTGNYAAHYTDEQERNFRFDCRLNPEASKNTFIHHPMLRFVLLSRPASPYLRLNSSRKRFSNGGDMRTTTKHSIDSTMRRIHSKLRPTSRWRIATSLSLNPILYRVVHLLCVCRFKIRKPLFVIIKPSLLFKIDTD